MILKLKTSEKFSKTDVLDSVVFLINLKRTFINLQVQAHLVYVYMHGAGNNCLLVARRDTLH